MITLKYNAILFSFISKKSNTAAEVKTFFFSFFFRNLAKKVRLCRKMKLAPRRSARAQTFKRSFVSSFRLFCCTFVTQSRECPLPLSLNMSKPGHKHRQMCFIVNQISVCTAYYLKQVRARFWPGVAVLTYLVRCALVTQR